MICVPSRLGREKELFGISYFPKKTRVICSSRTSPIAGKEGVSLPPIEPGWEGSALSRAQNDAVWLPRLDHKMILLPPDSFSLGCPLWRKLAPQLWKQKDRLSGEELRPQQTAHISQWHASELHLDSCRLHPHWQQAKDVGSFQWEEAKKPA